MLYGDTSKYIKPAQKLAIGQINLKPFSNVKGPIRITVPYDQDIEQNHSKKQSLSQFHIPKS